MADYRVLACSFVGGTIEINAQLNVKKLKFATAIGASPGSISFDLPVPQVDSWGNVTPSTAQLLSWTTPSKTMLVVDRRDDAGNSIIVWCGILWTRNRSQQVSVTWKITGIEILSYFGQRVIPQVSPYNGDYTGSWDYATLLEQILNDAQSVTESGLSGNIGLSVPGTTAGNTFTADYLYNNFSLMTQVFQDLLGTEYMEACTVAGYSGSTIVPSLKIGVPILGRPFSTTGFAIDLQQCPAPGYSIDEDGTQQANKVIGVAQLSSPQSSGTSRQLTSSAIWGSVDTSYPLLEAVEEQSQVNSQSMLNALTNASAVQLQRPVEAFSIPIFSDGSPDESGRQLLLSDLELGDEIQIQGEADDCFPTGIYEMRRVVEMSTSVPDNDDENQNVVTTLTMNVVPPWASGW